VRVVETGDDPPGSGVDHLGVGASPALNLVGAADIGDSVVDDRDRRGRRLLQIAGPDSGVGNDDVRRNAGWTRARHENHGEREADHDHSTHQLRFYCGSVLISLSSRLTSSSNWSTTAPTVSGLLRFTPAFC